MKYGRSADEHPPISVSQLIDRTKILRTVDELKVCSQVRLTGWSPLEYGVNNNEMFGHIDFKAH
jgi:hypothetical protein